MAIPIGAQPVTVLMDTLTHSLDVARQLIMTPSGNGLETETEATVLTEGKPK